MSGKVISLLIRIDGGSADQGILDIHDAAGTLYGMARSVNTVIHSFSNNEEVKKRVDTAKGATAFVHSSQKGCFEEQIDIHFDPIVVKRIGHSVITNNFWDYLTWCWSDAVGISHTPTTPYVKKIQEKNDVFIDEISTALESCMAKLHEPINGNNSMTITLERPRIGDVLTLDVGTLQYVTVVDESEEKSYIRGNVTKFNILSDFGRIFSDEENKIVSFKLAMHDNIRARDLVINSMSKKNAGDDGKLFFKVGKVVNVKNQVKRYVVYDVNYGSSVNE